jgi:hypothetical protein
VTTLPSATRVSFTLHAARNGLTCDVLRLRVRVNALVVGTFSLAGGEESSDESFAFAAISGPTFVIRLEVPGSVSGGCGSVELALDTSPWRLE